jgi:DNA-binding response OmpR family regulator
MKIHIVEDEKELRTAAEYFLKNGDFEVSSSISGQTAVGEVLANDPDALLLDIIMPVKSGYQVLEELRAAGFKKPVIVLSNLDSQSLDMERLDPLNVSKIVLKVGTQFDELNMVLRKLVEKENAPKT